LWEPYKDEEVPCWLCDRPVYYPPFNFFVPDPNDKAQTKLLVCPLCPACHDLPKQLKAARSFKLLKKMYKARTGRPLVFHFHS
jgi:hypothetical protein